MLGGEQGSERLTEEAEECYQDSCGTVHLVCSIFGGHSVVYVVCWKSDVLVIGFPNWLEAAVALMFVFESSSS
jgi:hypothetical protein